MSLALILLIILWSSLIVYVTLGGADFGAGVWDLLAFGTDRYRQRRLINSALGPVWEANHVWLIFLIVGLFTTFPVVFALLSIVLFIPLTLALIGIVLRGAAFVFRTHTLKSRNPLVRVWNRIFSVASTITPFFLGASAAAVASGRIHTRAGEVKADLGSAWLSPFAITIGLMAISLCGALAAVYLTIEAKNEREQDLVDAYRRRALAAGGVTAVLGLLGLLLAPSQAPLLWHNMLDHALPVVLATMIIGLATAISLILRYYQAARILVVISTAFLLGSWG